MKINPVAIILIVLSFASLKVNSQSVSGKVIDYNSEMPIEGALISIGDEYKNITTDDKGFFKIESISSGSYDVNISMTGYKSEIIKLIIAQDQNKVLTVKLIPSEITTGEIKVTSVRYETILKEVSLPMEVISSDDILRRPVNNISEALNNRPGISLTRDGIWSTDISIRGLSKSSIVMLIDGNRVETANDLSARLSMVEVSDIDRIEVIKGGVSSLYGTGAIGGVVNIFTKGGSYRGKNFLYSSFISGYNSVNNNGNIWLSVNAGSQKWFAKLTGSLRKASDINTPAGELSNSSFKDNNISASLGFKPFKKHEINLSYQNYNASEVGIPGGYPLFPVNALVSYPTEKRNMISAKYSINNLSDVFKQISGKYFYQYIFRDVENIPYTVQIKPAGNGQPKQRISVLKINPEGKHYTTGVQIQSDFSFGKNNIFISGIDAWQRNLVSNRERDLKTETFDSSGTIVISTVYKTIGEKPLPDASYRSTGVYAQNENKFFKNKIRLTIGARADRIDVSNTVTVQPYYEIINGIINYSPAGQRIIWNAGNENDISWSANLGLIYSFRKEIDFTLNASRSFRSPSLEERYQYIDLGSLLRIGNPDLSPEKGLFFDAGIRLWYPEFSFSGNVFYNSFSDLVAEVSGTYEGRSALVKTNIGEARLYGYDLSFMYNFYKSFVAYGNLSYVRGEDTKNNVNLPQISPLNGSLGLKLSLLKYLYADVNSVVSESQNNTASGEITTAGYALLNAGLYSVPFILNKSGNLRLTVFAGAENIFNKDYRNFLSTVRGNVTTEPGRNFYLKLKFDI